MSQKRETTGRESGWVDLLADVQNEEQVDAELLVRYANDPDVLTQAERDLVEGALEVSPETADTLRALQNANWAALSAAAQREPVPAIRSESWLKRLRDALSLSLPTGPQLGLAAAAILLLLFGLPYLQRDSSLPGPEQRVAQSDPPDAPPVADSGSVDRPESVEPAPEREPETTPEAVETPPSPGEPSRSPAPGPVLLAMAAPRYVPPGRATSRPRGTSVVRGGAQPLRIHAVVPEHVGLTALAQPTLYWAYDGSMPLDASVEFVITDEEGIDPLATQMLPRPVAPGIQALSLAKLEVELVAGVEYRWSVRVKSSELSPLSSTVRGWVQRIELSPDVAAQIRASGPNKRAAELAASGLWYDAFAEVQLRKIRSPDAISVHEAEGTLLKQIGLESLLEE